MKEKAVKTEKTSKTRAKKETATKTKVLSDAAKKPAAKIEIGAKKVSGVESSC